MLVPLRLTRRPMQTNQTLNDFLKRKVAFSISRGPWNRTSLREHDRVHGSCFTEGRIESPNPVKTALGPSAGRQITSVTLILASAGDLRFVPWPLPEHRYFPIEVVLLDSEHNIDIRAWASHCKRGVAIRWAPSEASDANEALDDILNRASGELIVALDTYRSQDITDVGDLLRGHENGASFMKDTMVSPELDSDCKRFHVNEASIALHYSSANGTPIRDFGLGSFALRRNVVSKVLAVRRPPAGEGSPLGREAVASLAVAASVAGLTIHESPVYCTERNSYPLSPAFLAQLRLTPFPSVRSFGGNTSAVPTNSVRFVPDSS